jgi:hypothetical protein
MDLERNYVFSGSFEVVENIAAASYYVVSW